MKLLLLLPRLLLLLLLLMLLLLLLVPLLLLLWLLMLFLPLIMIIYISLFFPLLYCRNNSVLFSHTLYFFLCCALYVCDVFVRTCFTRVRCANVDLFPYMMIFISPHNILYPSYFCIFCFDIFRNNHLLSSSSVFS